LAEQDRQGRPGTASGRRTHAADGPRARARLPLGDAGERDELAAVLVARRQVKERILDGVETELGQELCALRADARREPERRVEALPSGRGRGPINRGDAALRVGQSIASCPPSCYKGPRLRQTTLTSRESAWLSVAISAGKGRPSATRSATPTICPSDGGCPISPPCGPWSVERSSACACARAASRPAR